MISPRRKERYWQMRKTDILEAAEQVFASKGYDRATIRDIAKAADYAMGTIYLHFRDKKSLYLALLEEKFKSLLTILKEKMANAPDASSRLKTFVAEFLIFIEGNQDFFRIIALEIVPNEAEYIKSPIIQQFREFTTALIKDAQDQDVISKEFDSDQAHEVLVSIFRTVIFNEFRRKNGAGEALTNLSDLVLRYFLKGTAVNDGSAYQTAGKEGRKDVSRIF